MAHPAKFNMKLEIELSNEDVRRVIIRELESQLGNIPFKAECVKIMVKTSQNYKAEWEIGQFRVSYEDKI